MNNLILLKLLHNKTLLHQFLYYIQKKFHFLNNNIFSGKNSIFLPNYYINLL